MRTIFVRVLCSATAFVVFALFGTAEPIQAQVAPYTFYQIDAGFSPAMDVNDDGSVVGWWVGPPVSGEVNTNSRGYLWTLATGALPIITDPASVNQFPYYTAINNPMATLRVNGTGTIAGVGCPQGCGSSAHNNAAIWDSDQGLVLLGSFDNDVQTSEAAGVNSAGQVVGYSWGGGYNNFGPFIWSATEGFQHLTGFSGLNGYATGINNAGVVVGAAGTGVRNFAFAWSAATGETLIPDPPGAATSDGFAINDSGVVVGRYLAADQTTFRVFQWSPATGTQDLGAPSGLPELLDINNDGDIVATIILSGTGERVPYLYKNGTWTNLNDLLPVGTGFTLEFATAINNKGWIVGAGTLTQGFLMIPPNDAPIATDASIWTNENTAVSGVLSATDSDADPLTYAIVDNGLIGTAAITNATTGAFTYTPNAGSSGIDTFTFKANDGSVDSNAATVIVTITPVTPCATDISTTVTVSSQGSLKLNRKTGRYMKTVVLKNGDGVASGPVSLVLDNLGTSAALFGADGTTDCTTPTGSPYINVDVGADGLFSPRERATVALEFVNPSGQPVSYTTRVLTGSGNR